MIECRRGSTPSSLDHSMRGRGDPVTSQRNSTDPPGVMYVERGDMTAPGLAVTTSIIPLFLLTRDHILISYYYQMHYYYYYYFWFLCNQGRAQNFSTGAKTEGTKIQAELPKAGSGIWDSS